MCKKAKNSSSIPFQSMNFKLFHGEKKEKFFLPVRKIFILVRKIFLTRVEKVRFRPMGVKGKTRFLTAGAKITFQSFY
jgi:hypothetical protein